MVNRSSGSHRCRIRSIASACFILLVSAIGTTTRTVDAAPTDAKRWGPYTIAVRRTRKNPGDETTAIVQIKSKSDDVLREIHGALFANVRVVNVKPGANSILTIELGDGGNDGLNLLYAYAYSESVGIKNLFATTGVMSDYTFKNLRSHPIPELVLSDDASLYEFDHFSRSGPGAVTRVYEWNGDRYVDATQKYPSMTGPRLARLRKLYVESIPLAERYVRSAYVDGNDDSMGGSHEDVMGPAIAYWANAIVGGKAKEAEQVFSATASPVLQSWLQSKRKLILDALQTGKGIRTDESKVVG